MAGYMPQYSYPAIGGYNPIQPYAPRMDSQSYQMGQTGPMAALPPMPNTNIVPQNIPQNQQIQINPMQGISSQSCVVTSREEATAVPADFNGAPIVMPQIVNGEVAVIYVKQWDLSKGQANFGEFLPLSASKTNSMPSLECNLPEEKTEKKTVFVSIEDFQDLQDFAQNLQNLVDDLSKEVEKLKKSNVTSKQSKKEKGESLDE